jgi:hypothetical protein
MQGQTSLPMPVDAISVSARIDTRGYWLAVVAFRRHGGAFSDQTTEYYDVLTASELLDVLAEELFALLGSDWMAHKSLSVGAVLREEAPMIR